MKKLIMIILLFITISISAQEITKPKLGKDKYLHIIASFVATETAFLLMQENNSNYGESLTGGLIVGFSIGLSKEIFDAKFKKPPSGFSKTDLIADGIGIILAGIVIHNYQR